MIKQIWFVRNVKKLINYLCITISVLMIFYTFLTMLAFSKDLAGAFTEYGSLLLIPIVQLFICFLLILRYKTASRSTAVSHDKNLNHDAAVTKAELVKTLICGTNFMLTLIFFFMQINTLNAQKGIQSFGVVPIYLCIIGGIIFYIITISKALKK